jgi:hypothetical protein
LPQEVVPYHSDIDHPSVFWITNGWNDFQYNLAAGSGTCGVCYWFVPAATSGMSRYEKWWSYASEQRWIRDNITPTGNTLDYAGMTPLEVFKGNACSTAMNSFQSIGDTLACDGVVRNSDPDLFPRMLPVTQGVLAPPQPQPGNFISIGADAYYPKVDSGASRFPTQCPPGENSDCSTVQRCDSGDPENAPLTFGNPIAWPATWSKSYVATTGVVTVTMDMGFDEFKTDYDGVAESKCQPETFCSWNSGSKSCGCALDKANGLYNQCQAVCSNWTDKDVQCPQGGCYGFGVKLPNTFVAADQQVSHPTACYPKNDDWDLTFSPASKTTAGAQCFYKNGVPVGQFCTE